MNTNTTSEMVRPSRARIALARLSAFMNSAQGIASAFSALALAMTALLALSVSTYEMNSAQVFALIALVFAVLALIGGTLLVEHAQDIARAQHRATLSRYIAHYSQELERETIARKELSALLARVERDAQLERENLEHNLSAYKRDLASNRQNYSRALETLNELRAQLSETQLGAHNLAWALVEDNDIRETTAHELNKIKSAQVFADIVLRDYAQDGLYGYDAKLNAKLNSGDIDFTNYGKDID